MRTILLSFLILQACAFFEEKPTETLEDLVEKEQVDPVKAPPANEELIGEVKKVVEEALKENQPQQMDAAALDPYLSKFLDVDIQMISQMGDSLVRIAPCLGGTPFLRFQRDEENGWLLNEVWYQDGMPHEIQSMDTTAPEHEFRLTNQYGHSVDFTFDSVLNLIEFREEKYTLQPDSFPLVVEECPDM